MDLVEIVCAGTTVQAPIAHRIGKSARFDLVLLFEGVGLRLELPRRYAGGLKLGDGLAAAYLGFVCERGSLGASFQCGVARSLPQGDRFGLSLLGIGFRLVGFGLLTLGGVAGGFKLCAGLLLGNLGLAFLANRCIIGHGFNAKRFLRVE